MNNKLINCFISASEENYNLLIKEGFLPEYINVKENGISWKGCYLVKPDGEIIAKGNWEYSVSLKSNPLYTEVIYDNGWIAFKMEKL